MFQNNFGLRILVRGQPVTEYTHDRLGNPLGQSFIEGRQGSSYELEFTNNRSDRVGVVFSVDGLSILDGKLAGERSGAYIVNGLSTIRIPGWMVNYDTVASFVFGTPCTSYSAKSGQGTANIGVIGVLVFGEAALKIDRHPPIMPIFPPVKPVFPDPWDNVPNYRELQRMYGASRTKVSLMNFNASQAAATANVGTDFGQATDFKTTETQFRRGLRLARMAIYYDDARGLTRRGIDVRGGDRYVATPDPFPAETCCKPPPGWRA